MADPRILVLDEATASVDTETERVIQDSLDRLIQGRTTISIAHRLSTLRSADRLIVLEDGRLVESGTHRELIDQRGVYYKLLQLQSRRWPCAASATDLAVITKGRDFLGTQHLIGTGKRRRNG